MRRSSKRESYSTARRQLEALLEGLEDEIAVMATTAAILHQSNPATSWTGFYRVVAPGLLRIGPYQGGVGCLEIPFSKGVCGAAARERETQVVPDVHAFPGHIACDAQTRSEIVVPVFASDAKLIAVLDIDSHQPNAFDSIDREEIEAIVTMLAHHL